MKKHWSEKLKTYVWLVDYHGQPTPDGSQGWTKKEMQLIKGASVEELAFLNDAKNILKGRLLK